MPPCYEGDPNCGGYCQSYCEPINLECFSDLECVSPDGFAGQCVGGICYF